MKNSLFFFLTFAIHLATFAQQQLFYFDKKFKTLKSEDNAKYKAWSPSPNEPAKVVEISEGKLYAKGVIHPANSLAFDGKVEFYDDTRQLKAVKFYKNGVLEPPIAIDRLLKKDPKNETWYLIAGADGEFCAYQKSSVQKEDLLYATGRIVDMSTLNLEGDITFYGQDGTVADVKKYRNGQETAFIVSTIDIKEPYEILGVVTHSNQIAPSASTDFVMAQFILKCKKTAADGVIGVHSSITFVPESNIALAHTEMIVQGTIIKLKNSK